MRALSVRTCLMWAILEEHQGEDGADELDLVMDAAWEAAKARAKTASSDEEALAQARADVVAAVDWRLTRLGANPTFERLRDQVSAVGPSDPLRQTFETLARLTADAYGSGAWRHPELSVEWVDGHPHRSRTAQLDPYHVDATTRSVRSRSTVELHVNVDGFDAASLMAVPALLVHELVCHVHARDDRVQNEHPWSEGFVDFAAEELTPVFLGRLPLPEVAEGHCKALRRHREPEWRKQGHATARRLRKWLRLNDPVIRRIGDEHQAHAVACGAVVKLVIDLNVVQATIDEKWRTASRLAAIATDRGMQRAVLGWRAGKQPVANLLSPG